MPREHKEGSSRIPAWSTRMLAWALLTSLALALSGSAITSLRTVCEPSVAEARGSSRGTAREDAACTDLGSVQPGDPVWHQFAHAMVDPLTALHREEVRRSESLMGPIRDRMAEQGYDDWPAIVNEHIVRAMIVERIRRWRGEEAAREAARREVEAGFIYLPALVQWLEEYDRRMDRRLSDNYPILLKVLESRATALASGRFQPAWQVLAAGGAARVSKPTRAVSARASPPDASRAPEEELVELENAMMHAFQVKDAPALERIVADTFLLTSAKSRGETIDKRHYIEGGLRFIRVESFLFHDVKVRIFGPTAVVNARLDWKSTWSGERWDADFLMTDVWVREGGAWRIVSRHSSYPATRCNEPPSQPLSHLESDAAGLAPEGS